MMMECFNDILLKLRELHEREVEGWQVKVQELSNKKGCDTKRMEELFTRNQQMKEQQRILTENIKTLENRLRAGLCDRCTVTQEVAKRQQQEFECSQIQSLQHISLLATEMTNLKIENKRLREDIRNLKATLEGQNNQSNSRSMVEVMVKPHGSPERPPSSGPGAVLTAATGRTKEQPSDGQGLGKGEAEHQVEEAEGRTPSETGPNHLDYKQLLLPTLSLSSPWKTDHSVARVGQRRAPERLGQHSSIPPQPVFKNLSSTLSAEVKPSRHVPYVPVPRHPQPIKASPLPIPWPLTESTDWVTLTTVGSSPMIQTSPRIHMPHSLAPRGRQLGPRRPAFESGWQNQSSAITKEPTVVFRLSTLPDYTDVHTESKPPEAKQSEPSKAGRMPGEGLRDAIDGPLDLSDRGKSKFSPTERGNSPLALQTGSKAQKSPEIYSSPEIPVTPPSPDHSFSSSSCTPTAKLEQSSPSNHQEEESDDGMDQSNINQKKVPVLTISLRPVVVLESLNSALQKQESLSYNGKSSSPSKAPESSVDAYANKNSDSGQEMKLKCKRKRETESDRDSDTDILQ